MSAPRFFLARPLLPGFWPSLGVSLVYLHVVILVPLLVLLWHAADLGWAQYWAAISDPPGWWPATGSHCWGPSSPRWW